MTTRNEIAQEVIFDLKAIERKLQNDVNNLHELIMCISEWAKDEPSDQYRGELSGRVTEALLSLTNNSGWISHVGSAIRESGKVSA